MAKEKTANYTPEMVATLKAGYTGADNKAEVTALANAIKRSEPSVRSKLGSMGLYVKVEKAAKNGAGSKAATVSAISALVGGLTEIEQDGLVKATAGPLGKVLAALTPKAE